MILYHATTERCAAMIFRDRCLKCNCDRYYTKNKSGLGYSTQGYIYLSNEITFSVYFANCHNILEGSAKIYLFKFVLPNEIIEPDRDELRIQNVPEHIRNRYRSDLMCSLHEYKSCRVGCDISFDQFESYYYEVDLNSPKNDLNQLTEFAGYNYSDVLRSYTDYQRDFLDSIIWKKL